MLRSLDDPYASYLDPVSYRSFRDETDLTGHYSGVGLLLKEAKGRNQIASVLANTPAAQAGIQVGDTVESVDGKAVADLTLDEVSRLVQGDPGTQVHVTVIRADARLDFTLTRQSIDIPSVESRLLKDQVGLIEVASFSGGAARKVREAIRNLIGRGARAFILDLRGNPGGGLDEAIDLAGAFLDGGPVVSIRERGKPEFSFEATPPRETTLPLVVLVDEGSASSSEIVAAAIQDRGRGIVVGTETYGKGVVQTVFALSDGSAVKITTSSYFTPAGRTIAGRGVIPDVSIAGGELQLARARQILQQMLADRPSRAAG